MKPEDDALARALADLPSPALPSRLRERTLALSRAQLARRPEAAPRSLYRALPAYATSAALLSADAVFLADAWVKIGQAFGG